MMSAISLIGMPSEAEAQTSDAAVVAEARSYMGTPYGAGGLDCSGFTSAVFASYGVYLPDDPAAQYSYGAPSGAAAGDLVFFDEAGYGISHVGIATGYGTVIHASTYTGTVTETPISDVPGYVGAVDPS
jgi:cell wall-associated NlpC family hydrolase